MLVLYIERGLHRSLYLARSIYKNANKYSTYFLYQPSLSFNDISISGLLRACNLGYDVPRTWVEPRFQSYLA